MLRAVVPIHDQQQRRPGTAGPGTAGWLSSAPASLGRAPGSRLLDPAMLGRFEILSQTGGDLGEGEQRLLLYDIDQATTREIEVGTASLVTNRGRYAWWLSGDIRSPIWHVLDLAALG